MSKVSKEFSEAARMKNNLEEVLERIDWASNTHKDKMMFGLDELGASIAREHRLHGVLIESKNFIIAQEQELQKTREQLKKCETSLGNYAICNDVGAVARRYFKDKQGE